MIKIPTIEQLVESYQNASVTIEELEAEKSVIKDAIIDYLKKNKLSGTKTKNGYSVTKVKGLSFSQVPMSIATELGTIKMEKKLDLSKLRRLYLEGVKIPNVQIFEYIKISEKK